MLFNSLKFDYLNIKNIIFIILSQTVLYQSFRLSLNLRI